MLEAAILRDSRLARCQGLGETCWGQSKRSSDRVWATHQPRVRQKSLEVAECGIWCCT